MAEQGKVFRYVVIDIVNGSFIGQSNMLIDFDN